MANILLVEDARDCQILVRETLSKVAMVYVAENLQEARVALAKETFDLILLDVTLPDGDGMEFFSQIQNLSTSTEAPVIFLTAKAESAMQATAFSMGADDYIVKPLRPIEFRARVEAKLRRIAQQKQGEALLLRGELRIELGTQRAFIQAVELGLTGREFKLLYYLAKNEGTVFSRDQLITAVWGTGVHVLDRTVDTHIYTLRKKLGSHAHYVESEVGMGYRLNSAKPGKRKASA